MEFASKKRAGLPVPECGKFAIERLIRRWGRAKLPNHFLVEGELAPRVEVGDMLRERRIRSPTQLVGVAVHRSLRSIARHAGQ